MAQFKLVPLVKHTARPVKITAPDTKFHPVYWAKATRLYIPPLRISFIAKGSKKIRSIVSS
jgi:hypothetical protein